MECGSHHATFPPGPANLFQGVQTQKPLKKKILLMMNKTAVAWLEGNVFLVIL